MKKLLGILVLCLFLIAPSQADDIQDLQIEGMSVGDSLLDYFSELEIKNFKNYDNLPSNMRFRISEFYSKDGMKMDLYDGMQIYYKPEDKKFILHGLNGFFICSNKTKCKKTYKNIVNDISRIFENLKGKETTFKHSDDKSGKSIVTMHIFEVNNGAVSIRYTDWSSEINFSDNIAVEAVTSDLRNWQRSDYGINE